MGYASIIAHSQGIERQKPESSDKNDYNAYTAQIPPPRSQQPPITPITEEYNLHPVLLSILGKPGRITRRGRRKLPRSNDHVIC